MGTFPLVHPERILRILFPKSILSAILQAFFYL